MQILVVHKRPGLPAEAIHVETDYEDSGLDTFKDLLDGGYLQAVNVGHGIHAYVDEDGIGKELLPNIPLNGEWIMGPIVFSRGDRFGDDIGLEENEALELVRRINALAARAA